MRVLGRVWSRLKDVPFTTLPVTSILRLHCSESLRPLDSTTVSVGPNFSLQGFGGSGFIGLDGVRTRGLSSEQE